MDAAHLIREAVTRVSEIRQRGRSNPELQAATTAIKSFQAKRFSGAYADLLRSIDYGSAARFFLEDLYSERDYSERDAQFSRIAGALQTLFPHQVVATAVSLAQLHLLSEELDYEMASVWAEKAAAADADLAARYVVCWRAVGRHADRIRQLEMVLSVGRDLDRLTRTPGLRLMLKMMRRPASAAGLGALQRFLEGGFDTFSTMAGKGDRAKEFLNTICERESAWIQRLSDAEALHCQTELQACIARAVSI